MKKWTRLQETPTPDGSVLALDEHDGEYVLRVQGRELMSTARHASELRLGAIGGLAAARKPGARLLVGGLGLGFTLRGALAPLMKDAEVVVAELIPAVVTWNQNPAYPLAARELADPRTRVVQADVYAVISQAIRQDPKSSGTRPGFDAIMLDADNGTTAMMTAGNRALFQSSGIGKVQAALRPGGIAAYWLAQHDLDFIRRLEKSGFAVTWEHIPAWGTGGPKHTVVVATPRAADAPRGRAPAPGRPTAAGRPHTRPPKR